MDPDLYGGKGGKYLGLIQFGPEEQAKYGVKPGMGLDAHMSAVENFLRDRGVKPGMGMLDVYSTINAGSPGRYGASDAANGGMPGNVADKVATMVGHRATANTILGDQSQPQSVAPPVQQQQAAQLAAQQAALAPASGAEGPTAPAAGAAPAAGGGIDLGKLAQAFGKMQGQQQQQDPPPPPINIAQPAGLPVARNLAAIMQRLGQTQG